VAHRHHPEGAGMSLSLTHILIIIVVICAAVVAVLLASRDSGARVTTIERKTERAEQEKEDGS
jgi:hypothetical protein